MYTVMLDTTQDITSSDQWAIILRYVDDNGVNERLISVVNCSDSIGKGMHNLLQYVLLLNNLNIKNWTANSATNTICKDNTMDFKDGLMNHLRIKYMLSFTIVY
jgi:hypothetical protein